MYVLDFRLANDHDKAYLYIICDIVGHGCVKLTNVLSLMDHDESTLVT